jgi:hypothetical protein
MHSLSGFQNDVWWRRGKNIATGSPIRKILANEAVIDRLVAGPAPDQQTDFACGKVIHDDATASDFAGRAVVRQHESIEKLSGTIVRVIDKFFDLGHGGSR